MATILLFNWNPASTRFSVESIIHDRQHKYCAAINASSDAVRVHCIIEFMLSAIKASLMEALNASDKMNDGEKDMVSIRWKKIENFLDIYNFKMKADIRTICGVSSAAANRIISNLTIDNRLIKYRRTEH